VKKQKRQKGYIKALLTIVEKLIEEETLAQAFGDSQENDVKPISWCLWCFIANLAELYAEGKTLSAIQTYRKNIMEATKRNERLKWLKALNEELSAGTSSIF
jgi:hypothetical protein